MNIQKHAGGVLFFFTAAAVLAGIPLFRQTVITTDFLRGLGILAGLGIFWVIRFVFRPRYGAGWQVLVSLALSISLVCVPFLAINRYWTISRMQVAIVPILDTGNLAKGKNGMCRTPYAWVEIDGIRKQLLFGCDHEEDISAYGEAKVVYAKGFFGFCVIDYKELIE